MTVDGYRFLDGATRRVMRAWNAREPEPARVPWTPLERSLSASRVAFISSAGVGRRTDTPFDQEGERRNPWWGDPTYRILPREVTADEVGIHHLHIDPRPAAKDLDCVLPLRRLDELVEGGVVGASAARHYSIMGYLPDATVMVEETAPRIAAALIDDQVDLALLVPV